MTVKDLLKITNVKTLGLSVRFTFNSWEAYTFINDSYVGIWYKRSYFYNQIYSKKIKDILNEDTKKDN